MNEPLRLKAIDQDDLQILAACLQDAMIPLREMAFMADDRRFMAAFNRFQWERYDQTNGLARLMICQSALRVDQVDSVKYRGLKGDVGATNFELLTLVSKPTAPLGFDISLLFADNFAIRLGVSELCLTLEDFGAPWEATTMPRHHVTISPNPPERSSERDK